MLSGKKILLGITGGIAAYKSLVLIRLLKKLGAEVKCVLTPASSDFITPLTVSTLSQQPAYLNFWNNENGEWTNHVELGSWGDIMLIAPTTANTLAKLANGFCDNLLCATYLSAKCPVMIAPAMDLDMYAHFSTTDNIHRLEENGNIILPAEEGFLASGLTGKGRMMEPENIVEAIQAFFDTKQQMVGKTILITAGPTYEAIDPVRFIGNRSSGKMGFALAEACLNQGAKVLLVTGPTKCELFHKNLQRIDIQSADDMNNAVQEHFTSCDGGIFAAAVSDYRPKFPFDKKMKKSADEMSVELVKNPDVLFNVGKIKTSRQWLVGFALETNNALEYGTEKLKKKNLDLIVVNSLENEGAGFDVNTNQVTLLDKNNKTIKFELSSKKIVAENIVNYLLKLIK